MIESRESERALLGAILIQPKILEEVSLNPEDFFDITLGSIYSAMKKVGSQGLDIVVLSELLSREGIEYPLVRLVTDCPSAYNYEFYERAIKDTSLRRSVVQTCESLAKDAFKEDAKIEDSIARAVTELVSFSRKERGAEHIGRYLRELYEDVEERANNPTDIYGLPTGISEFDQITHGLQKGEQVILAGQPSTGKSMLAFQIACGMAENGHAGVVYELEMSGVAVLRRRISTMAKIGTHRLRSGTGVNERWGDFTEAISAMEGLPIFLSEQTDWTTVQLRADLARLKQKEGVEWFVIDYMGLLGDKYGKDATEQSAFVSQQLHNIAKDFDMASLVVHSLNKAGYGRSPSMASLSGSANISYDADQIILMVEDNESVVSLNWEKAREAERKNTMKLTRQGGYPGFVKWEPEVENIETPYWDN